MTWAPLLVGFLFGFGFAGSLAVLIFTRKPKVRTLEPWTEEYHEPQKTITPTNRNLVNKREIKL